MSSSITTEGENAFSSYFVETRNDVMKLVDAIDKLPIDPPSLYIDLEGVSLSRYGSISIMQIFVVPHNCVYLLDIHTVGRTAFEQLGSSRKNLQSILQDEAIPKVFFDVRNDSDALYHHYQISLAGVIDL